MHDKIEEVSITLLFLGRKQIILEQKLTLSVTEWGKINTMKSNWMRLYSSQVGDELIPHLLVLQHHYLVLFARQKTQEIFCLDFVTIVATGPCLLWPLSASMAVLVWSFHWLLTAGEAMWLFIHLLSPSSLYAHPQSQDLEVALPKNFLEK